MKHDTMTPWTADEDAHLMRVYHEEGRKWAKMAKQLNRTSASVRNRFLRIEAGEVARSKGLSKNRCGLCKQLKLGHTCTALLPSGSGVLPNRTAMRQPARRKRLITTDDDDASGVTVLTVIPPTMFSAPSTERVYASDTPMSASGLAWDVLLPSPALSCITSPAVPRASQALTPTFAPPPPPQASAPSPATELAPSPATELAPSPAAELAPSPAPELEPSPPELAPLALALVPSSALELAPSAAELAPSAAELAQLSLAPSPKCSMGSAIFPGPPMRQASGIFSAVLPLLPIRQASGNFSSATLRREASREFREFHSMLMSA